MDGTPRLAAQSFELGDGHNMLEEIATYMQSWVDYWAIRIIRSHRFKLMAWMPPRAAADQGGQKINQRLADEGVDSGY